MGKVIKGKRRNLRFFDEDVLPRSDNTPSNVINSQWKLDHFSFKFLSWVLHHPDKKDGWTPLTSQKEIAILFGTTENGLKKVARSLFKDEEGNKDKGILIAKRSKSGAAYQYKLNPKYNCHIGRVY